MKVCKEDNNKKNTNNDLNRLIDNFSEININKDKKTNNTINTFNYSEILYYSLVFDSNTYYKILLELEKNNQNKINKIFKYKSMNKITKLTNKITKLTNEMKDEIKDEKNILIDEEFNPNVNLKIKEILNKLTIGDNLALGIKENDEIDLYKLNDKFHITLLYIGGKEDTKALELEPWVGSQIKINVCSFGISDNFIVCKVEIMDKTLPYYGNPIQHITIGLKKTNSSKFKLFPKDSPTAFEKGIEVKLIEPFQITGKIIKETKNKK